MRHAGPPRPGGPGSVKVEQRRPALGREEDVIQQRVALPGEDAEERGREATADVEHARALAAVQHCEASSP